MDAIRLILKQRLTDVLNWIKQGAVRGPVKQFLYMTLQWGFIFFKQVERITANIDGFVEMILQETLKNEVITEEMRADFIKGMEKGVKAQIKKVIQSNNTKDSIIGISKILINYGLYQIRSLKDRIQWTVNQIAALIKTEIHEPIHTGKTRQGVKQCMEEILESGLREAMNGLVPKKECTEEEKQRLMTAVNTERMSEQIVEMIKWVSDTVLRYAETTGNQAEAYMSVIESAVGNELNTFKKTEELSTWAMVLIPELIEKTFQFNGTAGKIVQTVMGNWGKTIENELNASTTTDAISTSIEEIAGNVIEKTITIAAPPSIPPEEIRIEEETKPMPPEVTAPEIKPAESWMVETVMEEAPKTEIPKTEAPPPEEPVEPPPTPPEDPLRKLYEKGFRLTMENDFAGAIRTYDLILKRDRNFSDAYVGRGVCYFKMGKSKQAIHDFKAAASLGNQDAKEYLAAQGIKVK